MEAADYFKGLKEERQRFETERKAGSVGKFLALKYVCRTTMPRNFKCYYRKPIKNDLEEGADYFKQFEAEMQWSESKSRALFSIKILWGQEASAGDVLKEHECYYDGG